MHMWFHVQLAKKNLKWYLILEENNDELSSTSFHSAVGCSGQRYFHREMFILNFEILKHGRLSQNVSTTPITAIGCRKHLPLCVVQLKAKYCQKTHYCNGADCGKPRSIFQHGTLKYFILGMYWM